MLPYGAYHMGHRLEKVYIHESSYRYKCLEVKVSSGRESVLTPDLLGLLCAAPDAPLENVGPRLPPQGLSAQASSQIWIPPEHTRNLARSEQM